MRVCVTGGTGFLGGGLARRLLAERVPLRVLARPSRRADELEACGAQVVRGPLDDSESVARAVEGTDLVYHAAAKVEGAGSKADFLEANVGGTERILTACLRHRVSRVVYVSSVAVYGPVRSGERIDEDTPYDAAPELRDFYAQSKILADQFAVSFARKTGLPVAIIRPGLIYGPGRPLPVGLLGFRLGKTNCVFANSNWHVPLNYIENLIDAMRLVSDLKDERLRQFNIVDDEELTLDQYHHTRTEIEKTRTLFFPGWPLLFAAPFAEAVMRVLPFGGNARFSKHQLKRALQDRFYDTSRIRNETGWKPKVQLREALECALRPVGWCIGE
jgi:nucleoside-diphosphate-sugar epimerase